MGNKINYVSTKRFEIIAQKDLLCSQLPTCPGKGLAYDILANKICIQANPLCISYRDLVLSSKEGYTL